MYHETDSYYQLLLVESSINRTYRIMLSLLEERTKKWKNAEALISEIGDALIQDLDKGDEASIEDDDPEECENDDGKSLNQSSLGP